MVTMTSQEVVFVPRRSQLTAYAPVPRLTPPREGVSRARASRDCRHGPTRVATGAASLTFSCRCWTRNIHTAGSVRADLAARRAGQRGTAGQLAATIRG